MQIALIVDTASVRAALDGIKDGVPKALTRALNRSIDSAETLAVRTMATNLGLTQTTVRKYGAIKTTHATWSNLRATTAVAGYKIPLARFSPFQSVKGVAYRLPGSQGFVPHAFLARMPGGHEGVFIRSSLDAPARRGPLPNRAWLPIRELKGPSLPTVLTNQWEREAQAKAEEILQKNVDHEVQFLLSKQTGGAA